MALILSNLEKAVEHLENSLAVASSDYVCDSANDALKETIRAGVIQNFEVAYEQCWKSIEKWLSENRPAKDSDALASRKELFRAAARNGLISDPEPWFDFGNYRNLTSHTYNEEHALLAFNKAVKFLDHARELLDNLRQRND